MDIERYNSIERALLFLDREQYRKPEFAEVARAAGLSVYHFQRVFMDWIGVSPKQFLQYLSREYALQTMESSCNLLDAGYPVGLSGAGRLYDVFVSTTAATSGLRKSAAAGIHIKIGVHPGPFGYCLVALIESEICNIFFAADPGAILARQELRKRWPAAVISEAPHLCKPVMKAMFDPHTKKEKLHLNLTGTPFQIQVWKTLLKIPAGYMVSYETLARIAGFPRAVRATAHAVACNPVAFLVPCHRVIRKMGIMGQYRWGATRKKVMLGFEAAVSGGIE